MKIFNINIFLPTILLLPAIYCHDDNHNDHDDPSWIKHLPNSLQHILKSKTTTLSVDSEESSLSIQEGLSTELLNTNETMDLSVTPEIMHGYGDSSSSNSVKVGVPIGSIILFVLICYCCFRCCCRSRETISQGIVIQPQHPPQQEQHQPNIVIQHIHGTPHLQPSQPTSVQHVPYSHAPPQMVQHTHAPQFQQQPPYPTGPETRQMLQQEWNPHAPMNQQPQQEWSPHAPMNQQLQQYPAPDYPYNASAPPPSYGKY